MKQVGMQRGSSFRAGDARNGKLSAERLAPLKARRGAWRYDDTARQRVENIFHLYDTNGSGELELNEYYMLDHIIHRFDRKDLSRLARKQADSPAMSWESDEDDERVRYQFQLLWDKDQSSSVSNQEFHEVMQQLLKQVHAKKRGHCGWSGVDRLLVQLESGPAEKGISELRIHCETMQEDKVQRLQDLGVENVTIQQVLKEMDRMEAVLLEWDVYGELEWESSFEQSQLEIALLHSTNDHQTCLFLQMCLREASVEQIVAIRERIHNIEDSLTAHMKRCNKRLKAFQTQE